MGLLIDRRPTVTVWVGSVPVGSDHPVVVQSMTDTVTSNIPATVAQIAALAKAGSELVRVTVNDEAAAMAVPVIIAQLAAKGINVPIVGDFHFNGHRLLTKFPACAQALAKYRINPGNVGGKHRNENFRAIVEVAIRNGKPVRIGVNWGSLDRYVLARLMDENATRTIPLSADDVMIQAMVESAMESARLAEEIGQPHNQIILSAKVSSLPQLVAVYQRLAPLSDYPLHLGLTEAGMGSKGIVTSSAALGVLLQQGIGDTIRVSLTPGPGSQRTEEVEVCQQVLQALGLRSFTAEVASCPGCGRTSDTFYRLLAQRVQDHLAEQMPLWLTTHPGSEELRVAVMGCVVNGPGESKRAHIGISLPGSFEAPVAPVYIDGELSVTLRGDELVEEFLSLIDDYVGRHWAPATISATD